MKHNLKITLVILGMFLLTQFVGLAVQKADIFHIQQVNENGELVKIDNPYLTWIQPPEPQNQRDSISLFSQIVFSFIIAILLIFLLSRYKVEFFVRMWFFLVVVIALFLGFYAFFKLAGFNLSQILIVIICLVLSLPLAYIKIFQRNFFVHNFTEFLIYPGISTVFVAILNIYTLVLFLILISVYDAWAVWHSGVMQKMAKYQINKLNIFSGFFVPYVSKAMKQKIKNMKQKLTSAQLKQKKIKVNVAMLGGGDIIFPIISAGIMYKEYGIYSALLVVLGATIGLGYLLFFAEKKKFYPAMPFITAGIFLAMILSYLLF